MIPDNLDKSFEKAIKQAETIYVEELKQWFDLPLRRISIEGLFQNS